MERQAPGPADLNPHPVFCTKHVSIAPLPKSKSKLEKEFNEPILLYPNYALTRPSHSPAVKYSQSHKVTRDDLSVSDNSYASTAPTSTLSKTAVTIAPPKYQNLTDRQLELLLRKQFRDQPQHVTPASVSFKAVDKELHVKIIKK